jgi:hypothetical protein
MKDTAVIAYIRLVQTIDEVTNKPSTTTFEGTTGAVYCLTFP